MTTLTNIELGDKVYTLVENIPVGISGLLADGFLIDQSVYMAENYTGDNIPVTAIADQYQPAIINLTIAQVLGQMEAQGLGTKAVSIGELKITKGMVEGSSKSFKDLGVSQLTNLGHKMSFYSTFN